MTSSPPVRAVLWDADGVLQQVPSSWFDLLGEAVGADEALALLDLLLPQMGAAIRGDRRMSELLPGFLGERGLADRLEQISEIWGTIDPLESAREVVRELRASGTACHLATNQDDLRTSYMRSRMGYDELLDQCFYSSEVGASKPDEAFFTTVAGELGLDLGELAFVDDTLENVEAAQVLGVRALLWHDRDGAEALRAGLRGLGVPL
ncbi:MAG: HAD-IA family hydrolase [Marmoricola sp.]|nr:HAD-IA family hydrolase [Marmoricola sp.]